MSAVELRTHRGYPTPLGNFWEVYFEFPERYDRFALSTLHAARLVHSLVDFRDARVLDVGSGTGKNAAEHAKLARSVVGIEPMPKMRAFADDRIRALGLANVEFRDGTAEDLSSFDDDVFDIAISMHGAPFPWDTDDRFVRGSERVVRDGGHIIVVGTTPGWRPLHSRGEEFGSPDTRRAMGRLEQLGFSVRDFVVDMDYGTEQEALDTFGFIYGPAAIDYILDHHTAQQQWGLRIYHRAV
jgi:SAM-dependent methyltransferase